MSPTLVGFSHESAVLLRFAKQRWNNDRTKNTVHLLHRDKRHERTSTIPTQPRLRILTRNVDNNLHRRTERSRNTSPKKNDLAHLDRRLKRDVIKLRSHSKFARMTLRANGRT